MPAIINEKILIYKNKKYKPNKKDITYMKKL